MIRSFRCADTERLFRREAVRRFKAMERQALRKLDLLDAAPDLRTLTALPGNRLEKLKGIARGGTAFASMNDGAFALCGARDTPTKSRSSITTSPHFSRAVHARREVCVPVPGMRRDSSSQEPLLRMTPFLASS